MNEEPGLLEVQENNTMITFGRKLKHLRQKNHLTQKELGIAVGFPDSCADVRIPIAAPIPIQISCLLVRLNATLFFTFVKSFGTLTYAMIFTPSCNLVRVKYRLT